MAQDAAAPPPTTLLTFLTKSKAHGGDNSDKKKKHQSSNASFTSRGSTVGGQSLAAGTCVSGLTMGNASYTNDLMIQKATRDRMRREEAMEDAYELLKHRPKEEQEMLFPATFDQVLTQKRKENAEHDRLQDQRFQDAFDALVEERSSKKTDFSFRNTKGSSAKKTKNPKSFDDIWDEKDDGEEGEDGSPTEKTTRSNRTSTSRSNRCDDDATICTNDILGAFGFGDSSHGQQGDQNRALVLVTPKKEKRSMKGKRPNILRRGVRPSFLKSPAAKHQKQQQRQHDGGEDECALLSSTPSSFIDSPSTDTLLTVSTSASHSATSVDDFPLMAELTSPVKTTTITKKKTKVSKDKNGKTKTSSKSKTESTGEERKKRRVSSKSKTKEKESNGKQKSGPSSSALASPMEPAAKSTTRSSTTRTKKSKATSAGKTLSATTSDDAEKKTLRRKKKASGSSGGVGDGEQRPKSKSKIEVDGGEEGDPKCKPRIRKSSTTAKTSSSSNEKPRKTKTSAADKTSSKTRRSSSSGNDEVKTVKKKKRSSTTTTSSSTKPAKPTSSGWWPGKNKDRTLMQ